MDEDKSDLTSLEKIGEFEHQEDPSVSEQLEEGTKEREKEREKNQKPNTEIEKMVDETITSEISIDQSDFKIEGNEELETPPPFEFPSSSELQNQEEDNFPPPFEAIEEIAPRPSSPPPELDSLEIKKEDKEEIEEIEETVNPQSPINKEILEIKEFAESIQYGDISLIEGGGPHFSVSIKNIKYEEDAEEIYTILEEHNLTKDKEEMIKNSLGRGRLIISQINEYSAIYLVHKFRHFDATIAMGLSEEMTQLSHPNQEKVVTYKRTLFQNKQENINLNEKNSDINSILVTTTPSVEGYLTKKYLGIISEHMILQTDEVELTQEGHNHQHFIPLDKKYEELSLSLRHKAMKLNGNAVLNVNFQLTPLLSSKKGPSEIRENVYKLTCLGNAAYIVPHD